MAKTKKILAFNGTTEIQEALRNHPKVKDYESQSHYLRNLIEKDLNIGRYAAK